MGAPYSNDLRERVMAAVDGGLGAYEAAPLFRVSVSYIYKALARRRTTGETAARPSGGGREPKLRPYDDALRDHVAADPDATLEELRDWFWSVHRMAVSIGCLWGHLRRLELTFKKSRSTPPSRPVPMSRRRVGNGVRTRAT